MKVKCEITMELDSGDFELEFHNLTEPGAAIDYERIKRIVGRIIAQWEAEKAGAPDAGGSEG